MLENLLKNFDRNADFNNVDCVLEEANKSYENFVLQSSIHNLDDAINKYMKLLDMNPHIAETYYRLATLLWQKGEIDVSQAIIQCQNAVELEPDSVQARLNLGLFLDIAGDFERAEVEFKRAIKLSPFVSSRPRLALALILIKKMRATSINFKDFCSAMKNIFIGTTMSLWDYTTWRIMYRSFTDNLSIFLYDLMGNLLNGMKKYNSAVKFYESALQKTGYSDTFYAKIGNIFVEKGDPHLALDCYKKAVDSNPNNEQVWINMVNLLQTYYQEDTENILNCYQNIVEFNPKNAAVFYELGHLYIRLNDMFNAVYALKKAVEIEPNNPFYHNSLGYVYVQLSDFDAAIEEYQVAIRLNPDKEWTSIVCQALAAIYHQIKDNLEASIAMYKASIMFNPENVDAYIALGNLYHDQDLVNKAVDCYCQALTIDPNVAKVYCNLGLALWEKDHIQEAIIAYHKAIELESDYPIVHNNLGVAYLDGLGNPEKALNCFSFAIDKNPNYTLAYYNAGRASEVLGNKAVAAEYYQMAYDLNVITEELNGEKIQERINRLFEL